MKPVFVVPLEDGYEDAIKKKLETIEAGKSPREEQHNVESA